MKFAIWVVSWAYWSLSLWWQLMTWQLFGTRSSATTMQTSSGKCPPGWYMSIHDDVIKWKYFPRYWPFVQRIHWSLVNSPHKGQWHKALMFSLICAWIIGWVNNHEAGDLRRAHYDVLVMLNMININSHVVAWWCHVVTHICINIGSGTGLLPGGTTPLPRLLLIYCHCQIKLFEHITRK